ncbi:stage III sporulation protein SpoIIIAB [Staphylospora marina]|uniref:stage III sporulation protein SpoIIIAB n=1 Tax=Staphylospora marina TaxID=2490858 RepID=UPI000F5C0D82|nr:stage III sporulation protein SpoIIIAB [Staphylospora marina]
MIKLLGALLVLIASTAIGFSFAAGVAKRPRQIRELRMCLSLLRTEIDYGSRLLSEAFSRISVSGEGSVRKLFGRMADRLNEADGISMSECLKETLDAHWEETSLGREEKQVLLRLGEVLGASSRLDQLHHLEMAEKQLAVEEDKARDERDRFVKMYRTVGILAGALLVILLY